MKTTFQTSSHRQGSAAFRGFLPIAFLLLCGPGGISPAQALTFTGRAAEKCNPNDPNESVGNPRDWNHPKNWGTPCDPHNPPQPGETAVIPAGFTVNVGAFSVGQLDLQGTLVISGDSTAQQVNISGNGKLLSGGAGPTLVVGGNLDHNGDQLAMHTLLPPGATMRWHRGLISSNVTQSGGALLFIMGDEDHRVNACTFTLNGVTTWSDNGKIIQEGGADTTVTFLNKSTFLAEGAGTIETSGYLRFIFKNEAGAEFLKAGGTGSTTSFNNVNPLRPMYFQNYGTVEVQSGILDFPSSVFSMENGSTLKGAGTARVSGGMLYLPPDTTSTVTGVMELSGGYMEGDGRMTGQGGVFNWTGGSIGEIQGPYTPPRPATLNIPIGMTMNISGGTDKRLGSSESNCNPCHRQHGVIKSAGVINWYGTGDIFCSYGGGEIINSGVFNVMNDEPIRKVGDGGLFTNTATGILRKSNSAGTTTFSDGFGLDNSGFANIITGEVKVSGALRMLDKSSCEGAGKLVSNGRGSLIGTVTISGEGSAGGTLEMQGGYLGAGAAASLITTGSGKFEWTGGALFGAWDTAPGCNFHISGTNQKLLGYWNGNYDNGPLTFNNAGNITFTGTGNIADGNTGIINNTGTFILKTNATIGTNQFNNRGTFRQETKGGTPVTEIIGGPFRNYGTVDAMTGEVLVKSGLELYGDSIVTGVGRLVGAGGIWIGPLTHIRGGTVEMRGGKLHTGGLGSPDGTIRTSGNGKFEWTAGYLAGTLVIDAGSRFEIAGPGDKQIGYYSHRYDNAVGSLTNRGIITWSGTGKMIDGNTGSINNEGTFNVRTDALMQGRMNNTGILDIGGTSGSLNFGGASIVLANSGTLKTELAGPTPDSTVGRIISGGVVSVAGKLEVRLAGGYQPNPGDMFPIINKGNGTFSNIKMPGSQLFKIQYVPNGAVSLAAHAPLTTFSNFKSYYSLGANAPNSALLAYALDLDPTANGGPVVRLGDGSAGDNSPPSVIIDGVAYITFTYQRPAGSAARTDIIYLHQCSTTLAELDWCLDTVEHRKILDPETSTETVTVRSSHPMVEGDEEFIRLKVSLKPG